jgi:hypothetical protein
MLFHMSFNLLFTKNVQTTLIVNFIRDLIMVTLQERAHGVVQQTSARFGTTLTRGWIITILNF